MHRVLALSALVLLPTTLSGQTAADSAGIRAAALDYAEGWYAGDGARMARAVHPELVKRIIIIDPKTGAAQIDGMGATRLVNGTRRGGGRDTPAARQKKDVVVMDITGNAAIAKLTMADWVDYLQLGKLDGRWQIVNVLWERTSQDR